MFISTLDALGVTSRLVSTENTIVLFRFTMSEAKLVAVGLIYRDLGYKTPLISLSQRTNVASPADLIRKALFRIVF